MPKTAPQTCRTATVKRKSGHLLGFMAADLAPPPPTVRRFGFDTLTEAGVWLMRPYAH